MNLDPDKYIMYNNVHHALKTIQRLICFTTPVNEFHYCRDYGTLLIKTLCRSSLQSFQDTHFLIFSNRETLITPVGDVNKHGTLAAHSGAPAH